MSADEYRAKAADLLAAADACSEYHLIAELAATAERWQELATLADLQDGLEDVLQRTRQ